MKAYTSRTLFDERARETSVREQMGQVRLDAEANLQADITRADARRRSADVAEGSPDDGFVITDTHLLDPILSLEGWAAVGLAADDERVITPQLGLVRRDPETLPHVLRTRGHTSVLRTMPPVDLLRLPVPLHPAAATYAAAALVVQVRFDRPPTDDEVVDVRLAVRDADGAEVDVTAVPAPEAPDVAAGAAPWTRLTVPVADLAALRRGAGSDETLVLRGWGLAGLPPRATVDLDALLVVDDGLGEGDLVVRGGDGTLTGAGRMFVHGLRTFIEHDWRYSLQPDLPDPEPLERPTAGPDGRTDHHVIFADVFEEVHRGFQDARLLEPALGGEETAFRTRKMTQIRALRVAPGGSERLPSPTGDGRLTTNVPAGVLPDRFPPEERDPCRDRCLSTVNATTGEGYRGSSNVQVRVEVLVAPDAGAPGVVGWSRDNAARVAPLLLDAGSGAQAVHVAPEDAGSFAAGDLVVVEDRRSRLDPARPAHRCAVRALRAVNTATGELELEAPGWTLTTDPVPLVLGGGLPRGFLRADAAAVRRWDGVDHLLTGVRYNLIDGIDFSLAGADFRELEHWTFTARVAGPDSVAEGVVEQLTEATVAGPRHERVPLARVTWTPAGRQLEDLRVQYLPLHEVRQRLVELGARKLAPGAFTVVVGDGRRTFGDIDQDLAEGVTGDEALQAALDRLGAAGGTLYVRAGDYRLEHPVLLQGRSRVRVLGDGAASRLQVTGAGGAFHVDACGADGEIAIERLALAETPDLETPIGTESAARVVPRPFGPVEPVAVVRPERPLAVADLISSVPTAPDLLASLAGRLRDAGPRGGRAAGSVVVTLTRLRRLQRAEPGRPLEDVAPAELDVLRRLPHGVVTVSDSSRVRLAGLELHSREQGQADGAVAAAVLVTGSCADVVVDDCRLHAPSGVVATPLARSLTAAAIALWPRSGLFLRGLAVRDCVVDAAGSASHGVRAADGITDGVLVTGNRITGFATGIALEDAAESRTGESVDRTVVRDNVVVGGARAALSVVGDGVDVEANEVRLGGGPEPTGSGVRAGIQVTGTANRVRDNWIALDPRPAPALLAQAGIVVGTGADDGSPIGRAVEDVSVVGNRVDGGGAVGGGVLVGGASPCLGVRVADNDLAGLGDAGVRVWASSGPVGDVRISGNTMADVAREYLSWGPSVVAELQALTSTPLPATGSARDVLDVLVGQASGQVAATDALLRWLERATLRGGVVVSLAEDVEVRDNRVREVGRTSRPAGFVGPGADIRTAGVVAVGTRDLVVSGNQVRGVRTPVVVRRPPINPVGPLRPPLLDLLPRLARVRPAGRVRDVFAPAVALRRRAMEYAAGDARARQRIGRGIYAAIEALADALDAGGPESRRLAVDLQGGLTEMLEAQGTEGHTQAAHRVRATLSRAAALTAPDPDVAAAWDAAARFDAALVGGDQAQATRVAAADVVEAAPDLVAGLDGLGLDVEGQARAVLGGGADQASAVAALADAMGTVAEARGRKAQLDRSAAGAQFSATDRAAAEGLVALSLAALEVPDPAELNEEAVSNVVRGGAGLTEMLRSVSAPLADRVSTDIARLRAAAAQPTAEDVQRLVGTLAQVRSLARGEPVATEVDTADLDAQRATFHTALVAVTADQLERRITALDVDPEASASRNLALIEQAAGQLGQLVGDDPQARATARAARAALAEAVSDVEHRDQHQARARGLLAQLAAGSGLATSTTGPGSEVPTSAPSEPAAPQGDLAGPLAGLGALVLLLGDDGQPAEVRAEAGRQLTTQLRSAAEDAGLVAGERADVLDDVGDVVARALGGGGTARVARHTLAGKVEAVAYRATQRTGATPEVRAAHVLAGGLTRALDPSLGEPERVAAVGAWTAGREALLSTSTAERLRGPDLAATLAGLRGGLDALLGTPARRFDPRPAVSVDADTADGAWIGGPGRRLEMAGNTLAECRTGITVRGADAHPLAPRGGQEPLVLDLVGNAVRGAALCAVDVAVTSTTLSLVGTVATGCAGVVDTTPPAYGQAVVSITGSGTALVADNRLRDNGNGRSDVPIHEVLLDWDGDVTIRGNQVRHAGSTAAGHGLAVVSGPVSADLVRQLVATPALVVEPAPRRGGVVKPPVGMLTGLDGLLAAGISRFMADPAAGASTATGIGVGGLQLTTRVARPTFSVLASSSRPVPATSLAQAAADGWLAAATPDLAGRRPLLDWLGSRRPPLIALPPPVRRSVQVVGNDVVAAGPALVVLHEGAGLVSATVVDNELESLGPVGAVYLRGVDTTMVAANRLESRREVNVVVLRVRESLVSVNGNTAAGREAVTPPKPPVPPDLPVAPGLGDLHLTVPVGERGALTLRLDPDALRSAIDAKRSHAYTEQADEAETGFGRFQRAADLALDPDVATVLSAGATSGLSLRTVAGRIVAESALARLAGAAVAEDHADDDADDGGHADVTVAAAPDADTRVEKAVTTSNAILSSRQLSAPAKLFGLAVSSGMPAHQARALVQSNLIRAGGDEASALASGLAEITGVGDLAGPTVSERILDASPVEDLVSLLLRNRSFTPFRPELVAPVAPPPDPRRHSIVVVGGSRVGVVGNVTTAGVHVHDAAHSVENNV